MDETNNNNSGLPTTANHLLQNAQVGPPPPCRVPPPIPATMANSSRINTGAPVTSNANAIRNGYRRVAVPPVSYSPSTIGSGYYGGYNNFPYSRPYMNMNMGGYSPFNSYGQSANNQYQNPVVIAAAESSRPAFESIQSVVQSFNAVSMMLESTFTAMHMSFQALLGVAENFTRLRMFMMKLYSTMVSFKLARWFLTKVFYLLKMVRGTKGSSAEEDLWAALSPDTYENVVQPDGRSWPLVVFTGLLAATPYFVYKLLNSVTPPASDPLPTNNVNSLQTNVDIPNRSSRLNIMIKSKQNWNSSTPQTISLVEGQCYWTSNSRLAASHENGGWLLVDDANGRRGYIPNSLFKLNLPPNHATLQSINPKSSVKKPWVPSSVISKQNVNNEIFPLVTAPFVDAHNNPVVLPHSLMEDDKLVHTV